MKIPKYLTLFINAGLVLVFSFWCFFIPTPDYSDSERRALAKPPEITIEKIISGEFARDFEKYATDRFPLRDIFRSIKAYSRLGLFLQKENNDLFLKDGHISKIEYPLNEAMLDYSIALFSRLREAYFPENKVYFAAVPDKNRYLADLKLDYEELERYLINGLSFATPIRISGLLSAEDYYFTDSHWRQDKIIDVAELLAKEMGTKIPCSYTHMTLDLEFRGVYSGQSALICEPDVITYLTNPTIESLEVTGAAGVYDMKKAKGKDAYEFFLSGNQPLVKIKNPSNNSEKKLIVFRDSFACSIMPLLAQGYSEVILVDLRYMNSALLGQYIDFSEADILILLSTQLLNNSIAMK